MIYNLFLRKITGLAGNVNALLVLERYSIIKYADIKGVCKIICNEGRTTMTNIFVKLLGKDAIEKERKLSERLRTSQTKSVEVIGHNGAIIVSKQDLASSDKVKSMRADTHEIISNENKIGT
ncbi:hypothetical protein ARAF_0415 [Arsenophonus endosymbiont of Aleurodicus floccissimus]|uniref:hypothetical protein n=1 Tax=Arsenophonus endosymbiont of Aleurodicus floccissimus TaxID=2152761 RepID=UPI000E6B4B57|nr:hypothetical protein [Arsenophonus endosymbiont of Aleurodicus floccissimus]SPP31296.1 hypothetical protein ARAF_0415 [Arsenophonus endosymbiont of Aleurodicus floccissimus]